MGILVKIVERYGRPTIEQPAADAVRRELCLCRHCAKLKPEQADNCPIAEQLFALCTAHGMALTTTRCEEFSPDWDEH